MGRPYLKRVLVSSVKIQQFVLLIMSSVLIESSSTPLFQDVNEDGGLDIIGKQGTSNQFFVEGDGDDFVTGGSTFDRIEAGDGNDLISGLKGDDQLFGEDGNDIIIGGAGDDVIEGGAGSDIMTGGAGSDIFIFDAKDLIPGEIDTIKDFSPRGDLEDSIVLQGIGSDAVVEYDGSTGLISINGEDAIQLDSGLDLTIDNNDGDDTWELF